MCVKEERNTSMGIEEFGILFERFEDNDNLGALDAIIDESAT